MSLLKQLCLGTPHMTIRLVLRLAALLPQASAAGQHTANRHSEHDASPPQLFTDCHKQAMVKTQTRSRARTSADQPIKADCHLLSGLLENMTAVV